MLTCQLYSRGGGLEMRYDSFLFRQFKQECHHDAATMISEPLLLLLLLSYYHHLRMFSKVAVYTTRALSVRFSLSVRISIKQYE